MQNIVLAETLDVLAREGPAVATHECARVPVKRTPCEHLEVNQLLLKQLLSCDHSLSAFVNPHPIYY